MRRTTVRMPEHFHELLEHEAGEAGLSLAGLIREAALARVLWGRAIRGESVYAVAAQLAVSLRPSHQEPIPGSDEIGEATQTLARVAPRELAALLDRLDQADPPTAAFVRGMVGEDPEPVRPGGPGP